MDSIDELLAFIGANPVQSAIVDVSDPVPIVMLVCGNRSLHNVPPEHLQKLYEMNRLPANIAQHLVELGIVE
jgi:hypothetical protein